MKVQFVQLAAIGLVFLVSCGQPPANAPSPPPVPSTHQVVHERQLAPQDVAVVDGSNESQVGVAARGDALNSVLDTSQPIEGLLSAWTTIDEEYQQRINRLIEALSRPPADRSNESWFPAIIVRLGRHREAKTVAPLINWLTYYPQGYGGGRGATGPESPYMLFPAAMALAEIGHPAIPELLDVIEHAKTKSFDREVACWVLWFMEINPRADSSVWPMEQKMARERVLLRLRNYRQLRQTVEGEAQGELIGEDHAFLQGINEATELVQQVNFNIHNWDGIDIAAFVARGTGELSRSEFDQRQRDPLNK